MRYGQVFFKGWSYISLYDCYKRNKFKVPYATLSRRLREYQTDIVDDVIQTFPFIFEGKPYPSLRTIYEEQSLEHSTFKEFKMTVANSVSIEDAIRKLSITKKVPSKPRYRISISEKKYSLEDVAFKSDTDQYFYQNSKSQYDD